MNDQYVHLSASERAFMRGVAAHALENQITPADSLRIFGIMMRLFVEKEAAQLDEYSDAKFEELTTKAFARFADGFGASIDIELTAEVRQEEKN